MSLCIAEGPSLFLGNFIYTKCNMTDRQILWEELSSSHMGANLAYLLEISILSTLTWKGGVVDQGHELRWMRSIDGFTRMD